MTERRGGVRAIYPLDEALGLGPRERLTLGVQERSLWAIVEVSEEKTGAFWERFGGGSCEPEEDSSVGLGGRGSPTVAPVNQYPTTWRWPVI